ncbi:glycine betaine ABC transporter substrate-binding protein [Savagea serpentis]|uniref:glycine betaine ABC transporter substrate-binding protein n=1 Tax=Savagea serpentis TaxID=2785297 RepID=UPI001F29952B|nr:glycine betaine ABC transporter substrate-binding protein [Savagea serpentis]
MLTTGLKRFGLVAGLSLSLVIAGCSSDDGKKEEDNADKPETTASVSEAVNYTITGIEPGAGVFKAAENAVDEYELEGWNVQASSSGAMATALGEAVKNEEPIIVTGWTPHWKFAKYDLKYLEDPKGVFGDVETINTMTRKGFKDDNPNAYKLLEQFEWTTDDMEAVMAEIEEGTSPAEAATNWVEANEEKVATWTEGVEEGTGEIELVYVEWDSEISSTNVVGKVLEDLGYTVTLTPLDNAIMWQAIAGGEADAMVAAWLPATHGDLYEQFKDDIDNVGVNLTGAKIGLVVPTYVDIDSIEDLEAK